MTLVTVRLACGHTRLVDPGIARMITAGHIDTQWCHPCAAEQPTQGA